MHIRRMYIDMQNTWICENDVCKYANYMYEKGCIEWCKIQVCKNDVSNYAKCVYVRRM